MAAALDSSLATTTVTHRFCAVPRANWFPTYTMRHVAGGLPSRETDIMTKDEKERYPLMRSLQPWHRLVWLGASMKMSDWVDGYGCGVVTPKSGRKGSPKHLMECEDPNLFEKAVFLKAKREFALTKEDLQNHDLGSMGSSSNSRAKLAPYLLMLAARATAGGIFKTKKAATGKIWDAEHTLGSAGEVTVESQVKTVVEHNLERITGGNYATEADVIEVKRSVDSLWAGLAGIGQMHWDASKAGITIRHAPKHQLMDVVA